MKAILPTQAVSNAKHYDNKEVIKRFHAVGTFQGVLGEFVDCGLYMSRSGDGASPIYCSIWVRGQKEVREDSRGEYLSSGFHTSGRGQANGYGYHKASAAVAAAIESVGIKLINDDGKGIDIGGVGDSAITDALTAIAKACGAETVLVVG